MPLYAPDALPPTLRDVYLPQYRNALCCNRAFRRTGQVPARTATVYRYGLFVWTVHSVPACLYRINAALHATRTTTELVYRRGSTTGHYHPDWLRTAFLLQRPPPSPPGSGVPFPRTYAPCRLTGTILTVIVPVRRLPLPAHANAPRLQHTTRLAGARHTHLYRILVGCAPCPPEHLGLPVWTLCQDVVAHLPRCRTSPVLYLPPSHTDAPCQLMHYRVLTACRMMLTGSYAALIVTTCCLRFTM